MSELIAKVMKEKRLHEQGGIDMKNYFIGLNYTPSGLCAMERDLLAQAKPFNSCIINEAQANDLVAHFDLLQKAFHKAKPRLKTVTISEWPASYNMRFVHIGQICLTLKEVRETSNAF